MAKTELEKLVCGYALVGADDWRQSRSEDKRRAVEQLLGARIAASRDDAARAVYQRMGGESTDLIPARKLTARNVEWAFFKPRQDRAEAQWMFDLVFWLKGHKHICFRLEPADGGENARHGYSHLQLSWRFNGRQSKPQRPLKWLPDSYPAFPIPGKCSSDRFLMLVAALHGFPACTSKVLEGIWAGRPRKGKEYVDRVRGLLIPA